MRLLSRGGLVLACTVAQQSLSAQMPRLPGCYDLEVGEWSPPFKGDDSVYAAPPTRVLVDTTQVSGPIPWQNHLVNALVTAPGAMPGFHDQSYWSFSRDSLRLFWGDSFHGVQVVLPGRSGTLTGYAQVYADLIRPFETAPVVARPVSCNAPLREEARHSYRFSRGIAFQTADSLLIGAPLPASLAVEPGTPRSFRVLTKPADPYANAKLVSARVSPDGRVREIDVWFTSDVAYDRILEQLIAINGKPTSQTDRGLSRGGRARGASWASRTISINLNGTFDPVTVTFKGPVEGMR